MKNRILCLIIATMLMLGAFVGCGNRSQSAETTDLPTSSNATVSTEGSVTTGTPEEVSKLNGVELSLFSIVYSEDDHDYSKRAAEYIKTQIKERTDLDLPLKDDSMAVSGYEIVVGETQREISSRLDADTKRSQFAILAEDTQIALEGDYFVIAAAAYFFIETYVPTDHFSATIPQTVSIHEPIVEEATNYVLLIGDGMGLYQTLLFDVMKNRYGYGDNEQVFYGYYLPAVGLARTHSLSGTTDSAAGGTALACGIKTINGYVGQDEDHNTVQSITELAASLGKSTGVMSTEASTGATPAAFSAHVDSRDFSSEILADQKNLTNRYGTLIDCDFNDKTVEGIEEIQARVVAMLDKLDDNEKGFFLMYEEAHIDKSGHDNDLKGVFTSVIRFNQVIARVMEYAYYHPNTFVIITADHETGKLLPSGSGSYSFNTDGHSSHYVPVFAFGDQSELFDKCLVENVQIPQTLAAFMGVNDFGDQSQYKPLCRAAS